MADAKVSELVTATSLGGSDLFYLVQTNTSKKITAATLFANAANAILSGRITLGGTPQTLGAPGIVNINTPITQLTADAIGGILQIPQGSDGQVKVVALTTTAGGAYTFNTANIAGGATVTLDSVGDVVLLVYTNGKWYPIGSTTSGGGSVDLTNVSSNIIPSADSVYDLGSPSNQWNSLYVSNNTIFIGGTPLTIVDGELVIGSGEESANLATVAFVEAALANVGGSADTGNITFANSTISASNEDEIVIQAKNDEGFPTVKLSLEPEYSTAQLSAYSSETTETFTLANGDFATGVWQDNGFGNGVVSFTGAQNIGDFFQNTLQGLTPDNVSIIINSEPAFTWNGGTSGSGTDTPGFGTNPIVPQSPIAITSIQFVYRSQSFISVNYDNQEIRLKAQNAGIELDATSDIRVFGDQNIEFQSGADFSISAGEDINISTGSNDNISLSTGDFTVSAFDDITITGRDSFRFRNRSNTAPIRIITDDDDNEYTWEFGADGSLTLPGNLIFNPNSQISTANVVELTNLYFTNTRAVAAVTNNNITLGNVTATSLTTTDVIARVGAATGNIVTNVRTWDTAGANLYVWFNAANTPELVTLGNFGNIVGWTVSVSGGNSATVTETNPAGYFSISTSAALTGSGTLTFTSPDYAPLPLNLKVDDKTWRFDNTGNLTLPNTSIISEGVIEGQPTLELQPPPTLTSSPDQKLIIKGGNGGDPEDYHLHLTTANNESISLFLGTDNQYVKIDSTGDVITEAKQDQYVRLYTTNENRSFEVSLGPDGTLTTPKLKIDQGVRERLQIKNDATGVIEHDCSDGHIFYHTSIDNNFTADFTNLTLENSEATSLTLVLNQGGTAYIANSVQIANVTQTIKWSNNTIPTGNVNSVDVLSFSILRVSDNYIVLGQLSSFG